jgi:hypothetical protein
MLPGGLRRLPCLWLCQLEQLAVSRVLRRLHPAKPPMLSPAFALARRCCVAVLAPNRRAIAAFCCARQVSASTHCSLPGKRSQTAFQALRLPLPFRLAKADGDSACSPQRISLPVPRQNSGAAQAGAQPCAFGQKNCFHW